MLHCLQSMYAADSAHVFTTAGLTDTFPCNMGLKQGCPLSPLLFGIYLDGLQQILEANESTDATRLNGNFLSSSSIALCWWPGPLFHSREGLQKLLDMLGTFSHDRRLTVSEYKSDGLCYKENNHITASNVCRAAPRPGGVFQVSGDHISCDQGLLPSCCIAANSWKEGCFCPCAELGIKDINLICRLFDTLVAPVLSYGCEIWALVQAIAIWLFLKGFTLNFGNTW